MSTDEASSSGADREEMIPGWLWWSGIGLLVFTLILVKTYSGLTSKWKAEFQREIQKFKKEGRPHSASSLQKAYKKRSPNQKEYGKKSMADPLKQIQEKLASDDRYIGFPDDSKEQRKKAQEILNMLQKHSSELSDLLEEEPLPDRIDFSEENLSKELPPIQLRLTETKLLSTYADALIVTGKTERALSVIRKLYRRARVKCREPFTISFIVGVAMIEITNSTFERLLSEPGIPKRTGDVLEATDSKSIKKDFLFALEGEAVFIINMTKHLIERSSGRKNPLGYAPDTLLWLPATRYLRDHRKIMNIIEKHPYYRAKSKINKIIRRRQNVSSLQKYIRDSAQLKFPSILGHLKNMNNVRAKLELLRLGVRAKLRAQQEGSGLTPIPGMKKTSDPFSGKPYRVKTENDRVILYSVGPNLKDDGGSIDKKKRTGTAPDVGIQILKPRDE